MMRTLLLETSTERGIVAIVEDGALLFHQELPFGLQNSQLILPILSEGLRSTHLNSSDFSMVGVGIGPGSYTGIRVGATIAKTLAFACHLPLIGVCTLDLFIPEEDGVFAAIIDAKIGGAYLQIGCKADGQIIWAQGPMVCLLPQAIELLRKVPVLVTPNAAQLQAKLRALCPDVSWQWVERYPCPLRLASVVGERFVRGEWDKEGQLELLYMRKTQAEIEMAEKLRIK